MPDSLDLSLACRREDKGGVAKRMGGECIRRKEERRFRESTRTIIRSRAADSKDPRDDISMPCLQNNSNYPRYTKKNTKSNAWNSGERLLPSLLSLPPSVGSIFLSLFSMKPSCRERRYG